MNARLILKSLLITLLMPGSVVGLLPFLILRSSPERATVGISPISILAIVGAFAGISVLLFSIWEFAFRGRGTLAPIDPPRILVVSGFYRYTRNPMYLAVVLTLLCEALFFQSYALLLYAGFMFLGFHMFVRFYEEPHLRSHFGRSYDDYMKSVPRWWITRSPYEGEGHR